MREDSRRTCPRCKNFILGHPALSRRDNATEICDICGTDEAIVDLFNHMGHELTPAQVVKEARLTQYIEKRRNPTLK